MKEKKPKKRASKYEKKLTVDLSFGELVKLSVSPAPKKSKKP
jgi:hypothetical protein